MTQTMMQTFPWLRAHNKTLIDNITMNNPIDNLVSALAAATDGDDHGALAPPPAKKARTGRTKKGDIPREKRLEQNRKAAIESRRRKKEMVSFTWPLGGEELCRRRQLAWLCFSALFVRVLVILLTRAHICLRLDSTLRLARCAGR